MKPENIQLILPTATSLKFSPEALARLEGMSPASRQMYVPTKNGTEFFDYDLVEALRQAKTPEQKQAAVNEAWKD